jgi:AsmA protein
MKLRQIPWKWLLLGLAALLLAGIAVLPQEFGDSSRTANRVAEALSAWTGGEVKLTGPLRVSYFPDVAIKSGFELTNASRLPLVKSITTDSAKISLDLAALLLGRVRIDAMRLVRPEITLKDAPSLVMGPDQTLQARVANLLGGDVIGVVRLRDGTLHLPTESGTETINRIDARFDASAGNGAMSSFGSFVLRGETVGFVLDCGAPSETGDGPHIPINLTLTSAPVTAKIMGAASFSGGLQVDGAFQTDIANARRFLHWAGIALPDGQSLGRLSASGLAHWNAATLTFDDGSFTLDGNAAVGLLAVTPGARPRIDGTLAFDRLVLDPYIGAGPAAEPAVAQPSFSDRTILKYFDADLRISAAEIVASPVKLGRGAFTISAKAGLIASEVGELELCAGEAAARVNLDLTQEVAKASLTASILDVPLEDCLRPLALDVPLNGMGSLKAEAATEGRSFEEMLQALGGAFRVGARNGVLPVDLTRLLAAAPFDGDGWSLTASTMFDQMSADCRLASGQIRCETFSMQTPRGLISGSGSIDVAQQTLDWTLVVSQTTQPLRASQLSTGSPPRISISGSLAQPMIRRADRQTLGEGSNAAANQVSPR